MKQAKINLQQQSSLSRKLKLWVWTMSSLAHKYTIGSQWSFWWNACIESDGDRKRDCMVQVVEVRSMKNVQEIRLNLIVVYGSLFIILMFHKLVRSAWQPLRYNLHRPLVIPLKVLMLLHMNIWCLQVWIDLGYNSCIKLLCLNLPEMNLFNGS